MRAVQSLVAENHTIRSIFPILYTLDILQPLKLSFCQVKLVICFFEKSRVVTFDSVSRLLEKSGEVAGEPVFLLALKG